MSEMGFSVTLGYEIRKAYTLLFTKRELTEEPASKTPFRMEHQPSQINGMSRMGENAGTSQDGPDSLVMVEMPVILVMWVDVHSGSPWTKEEQQMWQKKTKNPYE